VCVFVREIQVTFSCKQAIVLHFRMLYSKLTLIDKFFSIHILLNTVHSCILLIFLITVCITLYVVLLIIQ